MTSRCNRTRLLPDRCRGFTLIEVIVTLAVLGLALVVVTGYKPPWSSRLGVKGAAAELAAGLRLARSEAIARNRPVAFSIDVTGHLYRVDARPERHLSAGVSLELLTIAGENRGPGIGDIRFHPDGSSTGGRITLADGERRMAVGVDWLTGRVSIADVR